MKKPYRPFIRKTKSAVVKIVRDGYGSDWHEIQGRVLRRDNYRCTRLGCTNGKHNGSTLHVHHLVPLSRGGRTTMSNLQTLCLDHHEQTHPHLLRNKVFTRK